MKRILSWIVLAFAITIASATQGQTPPSTSLSQSETAGEEAFIAGNALMDQKKYAEALAKYREAQRYLPHEPSVLYNGGMAAYLSQDFAGAVDFWKRLKDISFGDWQVRAKLIQAYQALGNLTARNAERADLFEMRKTGESKELSQQDFYCREQFQSGGKKVMVFEHFELKGDRALRYVFAILDETNDKEEYQISLGSYELTNSVWRETTKPKPKEGERLFHLDGYFKWGHATYGMYPREPSYDETRKMVIDILEAKQKPVSSSTIVSQPKETPSQKKP